MADRKRVIEALRSAADNEIERLNAAWNKCSADKHRLLKEVRALDAEVARLQARVRELEAVLISTIGGVIEAIRELAPKNPAVAALCDVYAAALATLAGERDENG